MIAQRAEARLQVGVIEAQPAVEHHEHRLAQQFAMAGVKLRAVDVVEEGGVVEVGVHAIPVAALKGVIAPA